VAEAALEHGVEQQQQNISLRTANTMLIGRLKKIKTL
jgi:hypothetical protein